MEIFGNVGRDCETKFTPSGKLICTFSIAYSVGYGDKKHTVWTKCVAWEKLGELIEKMVCKGTSLYVRGTPEVKVWKTKEGEPAGNIEMNVQEFRILKNGKPKEGAEESTPYDGGEEAEE
jgi:single-strand DNA-binding protein